MERIYAIIADEIFGEKILELDFDKTLCVFESISDYISDKEFIFIYLILTKNVSRVFEYEKLLQVSASNINIIYKKHIKKGDFIIYIIKIKGKYLTFLPAPDAISDISIYREEKFNYWIISHPFDVSRIEKIRKIKKEELRTNIFDFLEKMGF